jgi:hypothetical protein
MYSIPRGTFIRQAAFIFSPPRYAINAACGSVCKSISALDAACFLRFAHCIAEQAMHWVLVRLELFLFHSCGHVFHILAFCGHL